MVEILTAGYQSIRDFVNSSATIPNEWDYIAVYDDTGSEVTRVSITGDSRCQWLDADGDNVLKIEFDITGSDSDISLPVTLEQSAVWDDTSANSGNQISAKESFASATLNQSGDNVVVTHTINIPQ